MCLGVLLLTLNDDPFILSGFILIVNSHDLTLNTMCVRVLNPLTILFIWDFIMVFRECSVVQDATSTLIHYLTCDIFPRLQSRCWSVSCLLPHTRILRWCKDKTAKHIGAAWLVRTGLYEVGFIFPAVAVTILIGFVSVTAHTHLTMVQTQNS